ncbi:Helix-turn-helix, AraC domain-containing protein [Rhizobium sp. PDO1-076]|uniref:helix-turn-helix domain-containing protein n=1 Tax=Rhizobium sp. PDO1-076 TaxID=1125979 RepID=UPI00024E30AC|nr:helix-turn-helix domain-containing protein [Rhizobium sp. PDO1-076]EHS51617.1 Helix-turn-helix, AraC domain-containing protein [Rhizobium sp. PDO1-076]
MLLNNEANCCNEKFVRADCFTTALYDPECQFAYWKMLVSPLADVDRDEEAISGFHARGRAYDLGRLQFVSSTIDPMRYTHSVDHVRGTGVDHWCLSTLRHGHEIFRSGDRLLRGSAGGVQAISFAAPFQGSSGHCRSARVFLNRDNFPELCDLLDAVCFRRIDGPLVSILREYILALEICVRNMPVRDLSLVTESFTQLVLAALKPTANYLAAAGGAIAVGRFNLARKYILENLRSSKLAPTSICLALGISRRHLYYLFERYGGVAKFIKQRRLEACCKAIADTSDCRLISSIAYSYGFVDPALFSRQFHAEFGFSAKDARLAKLSGHLPSETPPNTLSEFLLQMREA